MPDQHVSACLVTNPHSSHGVPDLTDPLRILRAHGWEVRVCEKHHGGQATALAHQAVEDGCNVVVDCAGDGTLNEIVAGVIGTDAAVGTLPGGTENLWAHESGISPRLTVAATQLIGATRHRVDIGRITVNGRHAQHFVLMAGIGFDGAVEAHVNKQLKRRIGKLAIGLAGLEALPALRPVPVRIDMDGVLWQGKVTQIVLGNTRKYAGFTQMTPGAYMDDGQLDVCLVTASTPLSLTRQLLTLLLAKHPNPASAEIYRAARVTIHVSQLLAVQVDGGSADLDHVKPGSKDVVYECEVIALGATLLVPQAYDGALFQPARLATTLSVNPLTPVQPHVTDDHANGNGTKKGGKRDAQGHGKPKDWRVQVLTIGPSSITAARAKNGKVVRVLVSTETTLRSAGAAERPLWGALDTLSSGDLLDVRGRKDGAPGTLVAETVTLCEAPLD
ncbi:MAG: diacylglycerol/lipid kinase family protein [Ktedonobacterales bacterium]